MKPALPKKEDGLEVLAYRKWMLTDMAAIAAAVVAATPVEGCKGGDQSSRRLQKAHTGTHYRTKLESHTMYYQVNCVPLYRLIPLNTSPDDK